MFSCEDDLQEAEALLQSGCVSGTVADLTLLGSCLSSADDNLITLSANIEGDEDNGLWLTANISNLNVGTQQLGSLSGILIQLDDCPIPRVTGNVTITESNTRVKGTMDLVVECTNVIHDGFIEFDVEVK